MLDDPGGVARERRSFRYGLLTRFRSLRRLNRWKGLAGGGVLVPNRDLVVGGKATVTLYGSSESGAPADARTMTLPAAYLPPRQSVSAGILEYADLVLTPATSAAHDLDWLREGGEDVEVAASSPFRGENHAFLAESLLRLAHGNPAPSVPTQSNSRSSPINRHLRGYTAPCQSSGSASG